jgi:hypothetical protein
MLISRSAAISFRVIQRDVMMIHLVIASSTGETPFGFAGFAGPVQRR